MAAISFIAGGFLAFCAATLACVIGLPLATAVLVYFLTGFGTAAALMLLADAQRSVAS